MFSYQGFTDIFQVQGVVRKCICQGFFCLVWPHSGGLLSLRCLFIVYCKFENFQENFIFPKSVKRHICDVKNSRLRHDLPISVNDSLRVISPFREDFIFMKLRICEVLQI